MNGNGYNAATKPSSAFFTKEQRARLEALTVARELRGSNAPNHQWLELAVYIIEGGRP